METTSAPGCFASLQSYQCMLLDPLPIMLAHSLYRRAHLPHFDLPDQSFGPNRELHGPVHTAASKCFPSITYNTQEIGSVTDVPMYTHVRPSEGGQQGRCFWGF